MRRRIEWDINKIFTTMGAIVSPNSLNAQMVVEVKGPRAQHALCGMRHRIRPVLRSQASLPSVSDRFSNYFLLLDIYPHRSKVSEAAQYIHHRSFQLPRCLKWNVLARKSNHHILFIQFLSCEYACVKLDKYRGACRVVCTRGVMGCHAGRLRRSFVN